MPELLRYKRRLTVIFTVIAVICLMVIYFVQKQVTALMQASYTIQTKLETLETLLTRAETGQRGYLLTQDVKYKTDYFDAVSEFPKEFAALRELAVRSQLKVEGLQELEFAAEDKLNELSVTLELENDKALEMVKTNKGLVQMKLIREIISKIRDDLDRKMVDRRQYFADVLRMTPLALMFPVIVFYSVMLQHHQKNEDHHHRNAGGRLDGLRLRSDDLTREEPDTLP